MATSSTARPGLLRRGWRATKRHVRTIYHDPEVRTAARAGAELGAMYLALRAMPKLGYKTFVAARHATKQGTFARRAVLQVLGARRAAARLQNYAMPGMARIARKDAKRLGKATRAARIKLGYEAPDVMEILRGQWKGPIVDPRMPTLINRSLRKRTLFTRERPLRKLSRKEKKRVLRRAERMQRRFAKRYPRFARVEQAVRNYTKGFVKGIWQRPVNPQGRKALKRARQGA